MARQLILQNLMKLAQGIGANPSKFMGTKSNITFLGKGPIHNILFQSPVRIKNYLRNRGSQESVLDEINDAMGFASAGKLNPIQMELLNDNLIKIATVVKPSALPQLPSASVTNIGAGIEGLRRFPKESHKFFGRPLKDKDFIEIERLAKEGKLGYQNPELYKGAQPGSTITKAIDESVNIKPGLKFFEGQDLPQKTASARATMVRLLDVHAGGQEGVGITLREMMSPQELKWLMEGGGGVKGDPITLFTKFYGNSATRNLPSEGTPAVIDAFAKRLINVKDKMGRRVDDPFFRPEEIDFAGGGLAHILQVPRTGYSKGRMVKGALAILNRNKKNSEYMFKASDNVSPGYAQGDMKYNAQLLADQLAEDAGVLYEDLGALEQTKFYGTAYEYLAKEMGMMKKIMGRSKSIIPKNEAADWKTDFNEEILGETVKRVRPRQALHQWNPGKGRKPNASGGLAGILEV